MSEPTIPSMVWGFAALGAAVLYGGWHEYAGKNYRDARALFAVGVVISLVGLASWIYVH